MEKAYQQSKKEILWISGKQWAGIGPVHLKDRSFAGEVSEDGVNEFWARNRGNLSKTDETHIQPVGHEKNIKKIAWNNWTLTYSYIFFLGCIIEN